MLTKCLSRWITESCWRRARGWRKTQCPPFPLKPRATYSTTRQGALYTFALFSFQPEVLTLIQPRALFLPLWLPFPRGPFGPDRQPFFCDLTLCFLPPPWAALALQSPRVQPSPGPAQAPGLPGPMVGLTRDRWQCRQGRPCEGERGVTRVGKMHRRPQFPSTSPIRPYH